ARRRPRRCFPTRRCRDLGRGGVEGEHPVARQGLRLRRGLTRRLTVFPAGPRNSSRLRVPAGSRARLAAPPYTGWGKATRAGHARSEEHTSELQSREKLVC